MISGQGQRARHERINTSGTCLSCRRQALLLQFHLPHSFVRHPLAEELKRSVYARLAAHLEGRDARLHQRIAIHQALRQAATLPEVYHGPGQHAELVVDHSQLLELFAFPKGIRQFSEAVVRTEELLQVLQHADLVWEPLEFVVVKDEKLQLFAIDHGLRKHLQEVEGEVYVLKSVRAIHKIFRQLAEGVVGKGAHSEVVNEGLREGVWCYVLDLVPVAMEFLNLREPLTAVLGRGGPQELDVIVGKLHHREAVEIVTLRQLAEPAAGELNGVQPSAEQVELVQHGLRDRRIVGPDGIRNARILHLHRCKVG
mmetsp:Transcript_100418/g.224295  ORF Transcript_100418/g.224295 Transcript_100418/m.224295 type:complete len:312 (-) Transcript_100418:301-1236(-)